MFNNHSIRSRLLLIIGVLAGLSVVLVSVGLFGIRYSNDKLQTIYNDRLIPTAQLSEIKALQLNARLMVNASVVFNDPEETAKNIATIEDNLKTTTSLWEQYMTTTLTPEEKLLADKFTIDRTAYREQALLPAVNLMKSNSDTALRELLVSQFRRLFPILDKDINDLIQLQLDVSKADYKNAQGTYNKILIGSAISLVLGLGATILFALALIRSILSAVDNAKNVAIAISSGNLNSNINIENEDEVSVLLRAMQTMQKTLVNFAEAQQIMARKHEQGLISEVIDASNFQGTYGVMAKSINELVQSHIDVKMQVVDVVSDYAKGNFVREIEELPGEKAKITNAMKAVKTSLLAINTEIEKLAEASAKGDFSKRAQAEKFDFMFRSMLENLNLLVGTCDSGFGDVLRVANALARGDLTQTITKDYPGMFGQVKVAINDTTASLKNLMSEVRTTAETINSAAKEIAAGNNDLSHRTEEQAASLEETAASMHELTSTVAHNSENAKQATELAVGATEIAHKGVAVVEQVVSTMENINESSLRIVDIISVIDDIAFQTNILALNAAVEAARAGEQGKGFAVVATEVRTLAQRAANAAGEIKRLIGDSVERVSGGSKQVEQAGRTMQEIVTAIQDVNKIISEIASASAEQNAGISQVGQAIGSMDEVTQQNAALVEQVAATAETLESQTSSLARELAHFKIDNSSNRTAQTNARPAVAVKNTAPAKASTTIPTSSVKSESTGSFSVGNDDWEEF